MARGVKKITETKAKAKKPVARKAKPRSEVGGTSVKPFVFVTGETRYLGNEPTWATQPNRERTSALIRAYSWYNYFFAAKEAKPMFLQWVELKRSRDEARQLKGLHESHFDLTMCWMARMNLMGLEFTAEEAAKMEQKIQALHEIRQPVVELEVREKKPTIQDHIRAKTLDIAGELDHVFDEFVRAGAKTVTTNPIDVMRSMNLVPNQVSVIQDIWTRELTELQAAQTDKDVAECYDKYTRIQLRNMVKFVEQILADCASYVQVKKVERKPRAKKAKPPAQIVKRFRFLKEFPDLKLKSESPEKLVASQEAWLFDVKRRKLIHAVADLNAGSMTVNGMTLVGCGEADTVMKTIRKPEELAQFLREGKPGMRKWFKDIKTTEAKWNGRSNEHLIILKAW